MPEISSVTLVCIADQRFFSSIKSMQNKLVKGQSQDMEGTEST